MVPHLTYYYLSLLAVALDHRSYHLSLLVIRKGSDANADRRVLA